jgi:hypothetical protein
VVLLNIVIDPFTGGGGRRRHSSGSIAVIAIV